MCSMHKPNLSIFYKSCFMSNKLGRETVKKFSWESAISKGINLTVKTQPEPHDILVACVAKFTMAKMIPADTTNSIILVNSLDFSFSVAHS